MNIIKARKELLEGTTIYDMKLKVASYGRVSTDKDDQLNSLENQTNYFNDMVLSNKNWTYVGNYSDEGISGTGVKKREQFLKMIEDAKKGKIDLILTKEVSRFARNTIDSIKYTEILLKHGVIVLFISDNINTIYPDSEFRLTLMASMAQDEVRKISERVKFGIERSIKDGKLGGSTLTGYIKKNGKLTIDKNTYKMIEQLFVLYASGQYSFKKISEKLKEKGYVTKKGKPYSDATLKKMLTNPRYKGYYTANMSSVIDYKTHKKKINPKEKWIVYKDKKGIVPAIVSEELWNKANNIYEERKQHWNKINLNKENYITNKKYTSKIFCKHDDSQYIKSATGKRKTNPTWQCNKYLRNGTKACLSPIIKESLLDQLFTNVINNLIDIKKVINELITDYKKIINSTISKDIIKEKIKQQETIKENLLNLLTRNIITEEEYIKEKTKIIKNIQELNKKINTDNKEILENISKFLENNFIIKKDIGIYFNIFINKVIIEKINNDRTNLSIEIIYNFPHPNKIIKININ